MWVNGMKIITVETSFKVLIRFGLKTDIYSAFNVALVATCSIIHVNNIYHLFN